MIDWLLIRLKMKLPPLEPLERPRSKDGRFIKCNIALERAKLMREGK